MKTTSKTSFIAMAFLGITTTTIQAKSWRIHQDSKMSPDFTSINAAMSSNDVMAGDTLFLDPGCSLQDDQTVSKQVTVVGCGYFRNGVPHNEASIVGKTTVNAANVKFEGVVFYGNVLLYADYATIERCRATKFIELGSAYNNKNSRYCTIRQCYAGQVRGANFQGDTYNNYCTIENCYLTGTSDYGTLAGLYYPTIRNCYIKQTGTKNYLLHNIYFPTIDNNIGINTGNSAYSWRNVTNVVSNQNNLWANENADYTETNIFTLTGNNDECYQLKEGSPALGAGTDGTDIGPSGGLYSYVLSGLPVGRPYYTKAVISSRAENDKVNVSLKIKMQNE